MIKNYQGFLKKEKKTVYTLKLADKVFPYIL